MIINPILSFLLQHHLNSLGISSVYNQNILFVFLSIKGIILLLFLLIFVTLSIFLEFSIIIYLLYYDQQKLSLKQIIIYAFYRLKILKNKFFPLIILYCVLFLPFIHIGFMSSLIPQIHIPPFIINELQLDIRGKLLILALYMFCYIVYFFMLFTPLYIILKEENIIEGTKHSFSLQKKLELKEYFILYIPLFIWILINFLIDKFAPNYILSNSDFNRYFLRQLISSSFFRESVIQYLLIFILTFSASIFLYHYIIKLFMKYENVDLEYQPYDEKKTVQYFFRIKNQTQSYLYQTYHKIIDSVFYQKHKRKLKIVFYVILVALFLQYFDQTPFVHKPWIIGHRGDINACENSVEGIVKADENDADYAEIDVQLSKDKVPVVIHDESLTRLAKLNKKVKDMNYSELKQLTIYSRGYESHISTLDEVIKAAKNCQNKIGLLIELKAADDFYELADKIIEVVENNHFEKKAIFMSFDLDVLEYMEEKRPEWWIGYCVYGSLGKINWDLHMKFLAVEENRINTAFLQQARNYCIPVYVWTVEDESKMYQYLKMGVSGIIGNDTEEISTLVHTYLRIHHDYYLYDEEGHP